MVEPHRRIIACSVVCAVSAWLMIGGCGADSGGGAGAEVGTSEALTAALANAQSGETVVLTGSAYVGSFSVPAGVSLAGGGATITGVGAAVFRLRGGVTAATQLTNLTILNDGVGVVATGGGEVVLDSMTIDVTRGVALVVEGVDRLRVEGLTTNGPVTEDDLDNIGSTIDPHTTAVAGVLISSAEVDMQDVNIAGFAGFGAVFHGTNGRWSLGRISRFVGTGMLVESGQMEIENVIVEDGLKGHQIGFAIQPAGVVATGDAALVTRSMSVRNIEGVGVIQDSSTGDHESIAVTDNDYVGIWVQNIEDPHRTALTITGTSEIINNAGAGLMLQNASGVLLDGLLVRSTTKRPTLDAIGEMKVIGDGLQFGGVWGAVAIRNTVFEDNARAGLLIDGSGALSGVVLDVMAVSVTGAGDYGVITQNNDLTVAGLFDIDASLEAKDALARDSHVVLDVSAPIAGLPSLGLSDGGLIGDEGLIGEEGEVGDFTITEGRVTR